MKSVKSIRSLARGLAVLRALEDRGPLSLHALSLHTGLPKASLGRILKTLQEEGFLRRGISDRLHYRAGVTYPSESARRDWHLIEIAAPFLDRLCQEVSWASDLATYQDGCMAIQETTRRLSPFLMNRDVLNRRIHILPSAIGLAYLAFCSVEQREEILARLEQSDDPYDRPAKRREDILTLLETIRRQGYAVRVPGYFTVHESGAKLSAIAVPVLHDGGVVAAINLVWISSAASVATFAAQHLGPLQETARDIEKSLKS